MKGDEKTVLVEREISEHLIEKMKTCAFYLGKKPVRQEIYFSGNLFNFMEWTTFNSSKTC